jgi:HD superfamily phosphohydrolase YqeK
MDKKIIEKIEDYIRGKNIEVAHMLRTPFWLKEIYPVADEAMIMAALCHDIERCFPLREGEVKPAKTGDDEKDEKYLVWHGQRSAGFAEKLLRDFGFQDEVAMKRIKKLIAEHSFAGTKERDIIRDADSLSFFENNARLIATKYEDKNRSRKKIDSELARIVSEKARELAKPFYAEAIKLLAV